MIIPEPVRKCVAFVGLRLADGSFQMAGSLFFIGNPKDDKADPVYWVTARHVIEGIRRKGLNEVFIRANATTGQAVWLQTPIEKWYCSQNDSSLDVAILAAGVPTQFDHLVIPYTLCATPEGLREEQVGLGDEVFITGLFRHHHGDQRNIPIVRVGTLASMTEERVVTSDFGRIKAYLIEARSIGGLSGSPVFLNLGVVRFIDGAVKHATSGPIIYFIGLVHGHFDTKTSNVDDTDNDGNTGLTTERINTGIAVVVPFESIRAVITEYEALKARG